MHGPAAGSARSSWRLRLFGRLVAGSAPAGPGARWHRTAAWYRAPALALLALGIGIAAGRPDLVVLAAPLVLGALLAALAWRSPGWPMTAGAVADPGDRAIGERRGQIVDRPVDGALAAESGVVDTTFGASTVMVRTRLRGLGRAELATVVLPDVDAGPIGRPVVVAGGGEVALESLFRTKDWGPTVVARPDLLAIGPDGLFQAGPARRGKVVTELVLPAVQAIAALPLPAITGGWAGAHLSRRPGQGSDLVDLREFAPGDRLRSIHWRAYARHQKLHTRRTLSDADAEMVICVDLSSVIAPHQQARLAGSRAALARGSLAEWWERFAEWRGDPRPAERRAERARWRLTSLDHTVSAATAIAAAHLGQGDRVGLLVASLPRRVVRPGTGNRQLQRIRHRLAVLERVRSRLLAVQWWGLRPGQVVVICSALTQNPSFSVALDCQARGHQVIVIDVLPLQGLLHEATGPQADHLRILTVERELQIERLRAAGIAVLSWEQGDLAVQMAVALRLTRSRR